jgi:hypothetical protein
MVKQCPAKFVARDGKEFDNAADARKWEKFLHLSRAYQSTRSRYQRELALQGRTIDGEQFKTHGHTYWYVNTFFGMPQLCRMEKTCEWDFMLDARTQEVVILQRREDSSILPRMDISRLYWHESNARKALVQKQAEYIYREAAKLGIKIDLAMLEESSAVLGGSIDAS